MVARARFGDALRVVAYWGGVVLLFGSIAAAAGRLAQPDEPQDPTPPGPLVIGRQEVDGSQTPQDEARRLARLFAQSQLKLQTEGFEIEMARERLGLRLDQTEVVRLIQDWRDPESPLRRYRQSGAIRGAAAVPVPVQFDLDAATQTLLVLKEELDQPSSDAIIDLEQGKVVHEKVGRRLNIYDTAARIERTARAEASEVELAMISVAPKVLATDLSGIDFGEVLGFFETPYSRMHKHRHRTYNLSLAAQRLQGQILMPGEVFSFNDTVGERSEANGYRVAPVIAAGQLVDGMGGGTCQIAGTLHAAAFFAGLELVEREPHSRPSSYIRLGLDATVSYPNIDLKLRNPFPYPVVIGMTVDGGKVRGEILGPKRELTVSYIRTILESRPPPNQTIEDDTMPRGVKVVDQRGVPGYKILRWRILKKGTRQWRERSVDVYPPTVHIVKVGTNASLEPPEELPPEPRPFPDPCPMRITQGPGDLFDEQTACR
jgi:vancomycin resistance protein YoaR